MIEQAVTRVSDETMKRILNDLRTLLLKNMIKVTSPGLSPKLRINLSHLSRLFLVGNRAYDIAKPGRKYAKAMAIIDVNS